MPRLSPTSVESDVLRKLKLLGAESPLLDARIKFMEVEGVARYVRMMQNLPCVRCGHGNEGHRVVGWVVGRGGELRLLATERQRQANMLPNDNGTEHGLRRDGTSSELVKVSCESDGEATSLHQTNLQHSDRRVKSGGMDDVVVSIHGNETESQDSGDTPEVEGATSDTGWDRSSLGCTCCDNGDYLAKVFPNMLPTQASGRWSTTGPPLVNFPPDCINPACPKVETEHACDTPLCWSARDTIGPEEGWWFLHFDLDAIEAKWAAADAGDQDDLLSFKHGWDLHTVTACRAFGKPLPPILTKALHDAPECEEWRQLWDPPWSGGEDRRRHIIKTLRYATQFCISPKGVLQAKDIEKLGLDPDELVKFATRYLRSKPALMNRKRQVWDESAKSGVSYTWFGRRRRLYGDWNTRAKEGWSHRISGTVTDYQNDIIIKVQAEFPESHLCLNSHDGVTWAFPVSTTVDSVMGFLRPLVEREVTSPTGHAVKVTASWERINADLSRNPIKG